ncbi:MAG TPA: cysteine desulfurase family protein [Acidimicrobiia bacterium]|nr:cysteine desulfurase family protein [Acidimicrobiia bacterium]
MAASGGRRAYLDHASSSPLRPAAYEAMLPWIGNPGDPGRVHSEGRAARVALEEARAQVAAFFGARPREVIFTSGGTESVNAAIFGAAARISPNWRSSPRSERGEERQLEEEQEQDPPAGIHIVASSVEHSAVLEAANRAGRLTMAGVDQLGRYAPATVLAGIRAETALVSVQLANHEVGTIQPAADVVAAARERGVLTHVDACAAAGYIPVDFAALGADLCSVTAHKFGGPTGIGALLVRRGLRIPPFHLGGAQERNRRAGLENVAAAVGFAAAVGELNADRLPAEAEAAKALTDRLLTEAPKLVEGLAVFGDPVDRLPHLVCFGVEGVEAEPVLLGLDQHGVAVHSGSSCSSETFEPSPVLSAMGVDADHSLRVSVGWSSTPDDVDAFLSALPEVVGRLRRLR